MTNLIDLITPTNLDSEREKFFASRSYNPIFSYIWQENHINPHFTNKKELLWNAIKDQDHHRIVDTASDLFEVRFNEQIIKYAKSVALVIGLKSSGSAKEYVSLLEEALKYFEIHDVSVILSDQSGFNVRPNHIHKKITVSKHIHFDYFSMEGEVHHELLHVIRYRNGDFNKIMRSQNYLPTEEGLASWCQDNTNNDNSFAQHAIEYVASSVGITGSLRDIFDCMCDLGMSKYLAWKRASRHKFGFVNTSLPGDILKPAMYYANEIKIAELSTAEKLRLFVGKISLDELDNYSKYQGIWSRDQLVEYFKL